MAETEGKGARAALRLVPPRAPLAVAGAAATLAVPVSIAALTAGDAALGVAGLASGIWCLALVGLGYQAGAMLDADGVRVSWLGKHRRVGWNQIERVEVVRFVPGGVSRGPGVRLWDGTRVRLTPWVPLLAWAQASAQKAVGPLQDLIGELDLDVATADPLRDPDTPRPHN